MLFRSTDERDVLLQDVNYAAAWEKCDYLFVKKLFAKIQVAEDYGDLGKVRELTEKYETKLRRRYNGQYVQDTPSDPAPTDVAVKNDVITNQGMGRLVSIIIGKTNDRFLHYASGAGTSVATIGDTKLQDEKFRISMATDGLPYCCWDSRKVWSSIYPKCAISYSGRVRSGNNCNRWHVFE